MAKSIELCFKLSGHYVWNHMKWVRSLMYISRFYCGDMKELYIFTIYNFT